MMKRCFFIAVITALSFAQSANALQIRLPEERPLVDQPLELTLPPILGDDPDAARIWVSPVLHFNIAEPTGSGGRFPDINWPDIDGPADGETDDDRPTIRVPGFPGPGQNYISSNLSRIYVINPNMNDTTDVNISCYNAAGQSLPTMAENVTVRPRAFHMWSPPADTPSSFFWCAVTATEKIVAHGMNRRGDYIDFTAGGN
jgi:hypothetical protein